MRAGSTPIWENKGSWEWGVLAFEERDWIYLFTRKRQRRKRKRERERERWRERERERERKCSLDEFTGVQNYSIF